VSAAPVLLCCLLTAPGDGSPPPPAPPTILRLPAPVSGLATIDLQGDGRRALLVGGEDGLDVRGWTEGEAPVLHCDAGPTHTLAWCVVEHPHGKDELFVVDDLGAVRRAVAAEHGFTLAPALAAGRVVLPSGVFAFPFARDLNGDGTTDLALPIPTGLKLWFGKPDGTFAPGPSVRHRLQVDLGIPGPGQAHPETSVEVTIPSFKVADQNGDGHPDLAFEAEDRLQFFWSDASGAIPETPTLEIDLDEIKARLAQDEDEGVLDPANLFKLIKGQVTATVRDVDGDGCADLLLRQGSKVALYAGTPQGIDRSRATQVLKTSGNLLATFLTDDSGDGKLDLCMVQAADVSIGEVLLWVVAGGKLELDLYTYFQDERLRFSRSPSRKRRLIIDVPNLLTIANAVEDNKQLKELGDQIARQPVALDLDGDGFRGDLALLARDGRIELYPDAISREQTPAGANPSYASDDVETWRDVIDRYDREARGKDSVTIPLLQILDWVPMPGSRLRQKIAGRKPAQVLGEVDPATQAKGRDGTPPATRRFLIAQDLDGDGRDDLILVDAAEVEGAVQLIRFLTPSR
jgi:hypothetical protein